MNELSRRDELLYAAGLIDGEGCIGAYNVRQKSQTKSPYAQVTVRVGMCTPFAVKRLHRLFGGTLNAKKPQKSCNRIVFIWSVRNRQAEVCLRELLPFLVEKREQAEVALSLAELRRERGNTVRLTDAEIAERETYVQKLKDLKRVEYDPEALN